VNRPRCASICRGLALALAALGVTAATAPAAVWQNESGFLQFLADPGETNHVTLAFPTEADPLLPYPRATDTGVAVLRVGFSCLATADPQAVDCPVGDSIRLRVDLGDGDDSLVIRGDYFNSGSTNTIIGGPGNDTMRGSPRMNEHFEARDGAVDMIDCGGTLNPNGFFGGTAVVDADDLVAFCGYVDTPGPPDTTITSGPPAVSAETHPTFEFTSTDRRVASLGVGDFQCRVDAEPPTPCGPWFMYGNSTRSPDFPPQFFKSLANGPHVFEVNAIDSDGADPTPDRYAFVVDGAPAAPGPPAVVPLPAVGDRDNDGAPDTADFCPDRAGAGVPYGCPARGSAGPDQVLLTALADVFAGGAGDDRISGLEGNDRLCGEAGADRVSGGAGDDQLFGDDCGTPTGRGGNDVLSGGDGNDRLSGGPGDDRLSGGGGDDVLVGGSGHNSYDAGAGADDVHAANGRHETIDCGPGRDIARVDRSDRVRRCERVRRG
jgi:Ca2+-binding RTX toxin-like protein